MTEKLMMKLLVKSSERKSFSKYYEEEEEENEERLMRENDLVEFEGILRQALLLGGLHYTVEVQSGPHQ